jgi:hypothetical protein
MILLLCLLVVSARRHRSGCKPHKVDTLLDVRICRELDFDVCTPQAAADDAAIVVRYANLMRAYPSMPLACVSAWTMVQCSAVFHWNEDASHAGTVCRHTCDEFRRACDEYTELVVSDESCGAGAYNETRRRYCEDYSSHVEGRCYEVDDDDRRHYFIMSNGAADERDSGVVLLGCLVVVWLLWNKLPL